MTPAELRAIKDALNISVSELSPKLGVKPRVVFYYLSGGRPIPEPVALLARALDAKRTARKHPV